ncbi:MAG: hypothetical protein DSM106950_33140 [Stigonema ocellatum SAG 48.90 = DSM 106950]|nr:hypothetical protein [Stigonema ocellatum SAG 48.90 = DSM 106950]
MTYAGSTISWRSWCLGGSLNQGFREFLRKTCILGVGYQVHQDSSIDAIALRRLG